MTAAQTKPKNAPPDDVAQVRRAKGLYAWLWLSPVFTLSTMLFVGGTLLSLFNPLLSGYDPPLEPQRQLIRLFTAVMAVLGAALWHLVLLYWALDQRSAFVRWHACQALLLAGLRTALALVAAVLILGPGGSAQVLAILILLALWLVGNLWGQGQAAAGECSLMRWAGHGAGLPLRVTSAMHAAHEAVDWGDTLQRQGRSAESALFFRKILVSQAAPETKALAADRLPMPGQPGSSETADILVAMLRFSQDPARRGAAVTALAQAGLVEDL